MKKTIVFFYSHNGSNDYLAHRIAGDLNCPIDEIKPIPKAQMMLLFGMIFGIRKIKSDLSLYDRIILVGPIWMGKLVAPLKAFVKKYKSQIDNWVFVSCCGSGFEQKNDKFGHALVFNKFQDLLGEKCDHCEAFPITLVLPDELKEDGKAVMETRLSDENFNGEILEKYQAFVQKMQ